MAKLSFSNLIRNLMSSKEDLAREKLETIFQQCNVILNVNTGVRYSVHEVDCGGAYLMSEYGEVLIISWLTADGKFKPAVAKLWELVASPQRLEKHKFVPNRICA